MIAVRLVAVRRKLGHFPTELRITKSTSLGRMHSMAEADARPSMPSPTSSWASYSSRSPIMFREKRVCNNQRECKSARWTFNWPVSHACSVSVEEIRPSVRIDLRPNGRDQTMLNASRISHAAMPLSWTTSPASGRTCNRRGRRLSKPPAAHRDAWPARDHPPSPLSSPSLMGSWFQDGVHTSPSLTHAAGSRTSQTQIRETRHRVCKIAPKEFRT